jgi:hypothetical protein
MVLINFSMETEEATIVEFELSDDLIESYKSNQDIGFLDLNIKKKVEALAVGTLLQVTKKIGSPIKILSANEVDETLISSMIGE